MYRYLAEYSFTILVFLKLFVNELAQG